MNSLKVENIDGKYHEVVKVELEVVKVELAVEWLVVVKGMELAVEWLVVVKGMEQLASSPWQFASQGTQGWRGQEQMQLRAWWQVRHQPGQPGDGQPVDDPALSWLAHGGGGDADGAGGKSQ